MARRGMASLIEQLRALTAAGSEDYTVDGVPYWTDDQLQNVLDGRRVDRAGVPVVPLSERYPGQATYTQYTLPYGLKNVEYDATGVDEDGFQLRDSQGNIVDNYTLNLAAGTITFDADTGGVTFYLDCRVFDLYAAAADVWERKAAYVASAVDWRSDNHQVSASQEHSHCLRMAREYRAKAGGGFQVVEYYRSDEALW